MARLLPSKYQDRVASPRQNMPSARAVSQAMHEDKEEGEGEMSLMMMQWGQFVDHDITHTPLFRLTNEESNGIQCCKEDGSGPISKLVLHPECFPIEIPENDPFFMKHGNVA